MIYTVLQFSSTPTFPIFNLSGFEREPLKLGKQMIPHFVALDIGSKICRVQQYSFIRGCHTTFLLKSTLFKGEVVWQPLVEQQDCSPKGNSKPLCRQSIHFFPHCLNAGHCLKNLIYPGSTFSYFCY